MKLKIAVIGGDGIGPEVTAEAVKVTGAVAQKYGHTVEWSSALCGAQAIKECGDPFPKASLETCLKADAVLFGAVGDPAYDNNPAAKVRPEQGLMAIRKELGLYANLRPVTTFAELVDKSPLRRELVEGADILCIREFSSGIYYGRPQGRSEDGLTAYDTCLYTHEEVERIVRLAYRYARERRRKVSVVDKANILATSRLWREVARDVSKEFPDVETEYLFVDNAAMRLVQWPTQFDVIVTDNMFGDILTDEAAVISGSMGLLPSGSYGLHTPLFEPIHGSWPQAAGKGIANPMASILSAAMMLDNPFGLKREAALVQDAVKAAIKEGVRTPDIALQGAPSYSTTQVGSWIASYIKEA